MLSGLRQLIALLPVELQAQIQQCGLCTQRSSVLAWSRSGGQPLSPVISWRDTRAADQLHALSPHAARIRDISGLQLSAHYSASKIAWLINHYDLNNTHYDVCISPIASYLLYHLLEERPCLIDHSNAQRTLLFDRQQLDWSNELAERFTISQHYLPDCRPIACLYGHLTGSHIPLTAVCGDQNGIPHAIAALTDKDALINIGTGAFILTSIEEKAQQKKLLNSLVYSDATSSHFMTEATVNGAGSALEWFQQQSPRNDLFSKLPEWLSHTDDPGMFINTHVGLGSPWWCDGGTACFINSPTPQTRYVAIIESIAFLLYHNLQQLSHMPEKLFVSGGLSKLDGLCQIISTLSSAPVYQSEEVEASASGCAHIAARSNDHKSDKPVANYRTFIPQKQPALTDRYRQFVGELRSRCFND